MSSTFFAMNQTVMLIQRQELGREKTRNVSVEAFRCLSMFLIVLGHTLGFWAATKGLNFLALPYWWHAIVGIIIWHVDGFIGISGWFGIRFSFRRFIYLLCTILFYAILCETLRFAFGGGFSFSWTYSRGGWFSCSYLVLMLCSPVLNAAVETLASRSKKTMLLYWSMMAFAFTLSWAPKHLFTGINAIGFDHQTFLMMAFVYLTARCARHYFKEVIPLKRLLFVVCVYIGVILVLASLVGNHYYWRKFFRLLTRNHAPTVYAVALCLLLTFLWHVKIPIWLEGIVKLLSPSMFGVYLFHIKIIGWNGTSIILSQEYAKHVTGDGLSVVVIAIIVFVISIGVDLIRRVCVSRIRPYFDRRLDSFDKWVVSKTGGFT